jgi:hypothetical protein
MQEKASWRRRLQAWKGKVSASKSGDGEMVQNEDGKDSDE